MYHFDSMEKSGLGDQRMQLLWMGIHWGIWMEDAGHFFLKKIGPYVAQSDARIPKVCNWAPPSGLKKKPLDSDFLSLNEFFEGTACIR